MMISPGLPNAVMTRWITYIQLFTFEVNHTPGMSHHVPDGLSHQPCMADDSNYSDVDIDVEDGIKLVKELPIEINLIEYEDQEIENCLLLCSDLSQTKIGRVSGN